MAWIPAGVVQATGSIAIGLGLAMDGAIDKGAAVYAKNGRTICKAVYILSLISKEGCVVHTVRPRPAADRAAT